MDNGCPELAKLFQFTSTPSNPPPRVDRVSEKKIKQMVRRCMNHLKKKDYELGITKADVERAVRLTRVVDSKRGGSNRGGANSITINLSYWQVQDGEHRHGEYASFDKCPVIGGRTVTGREGDFWMAVSHEVSHHVQYSKGRRVGWLKRIYRKPHGEGFRTIYALVRSGLINPMLES